MGFLTSFGIFSVFLIAILFFLISFAIIIVSTIGYLMLLGVEWYRKKSFARNRKSRFLLSFAIGLIIVHSLLIAAEYPFHSLLILFSLILLVAWKKLEPRKN